MHVVRLASPDDPRLEPFRDVADPERVRQCGLFVAEGRRIVAALLANERYRLEAVLLGAAAYEALRADLEESGSPADVYVVDGPASLRSLTGYRFHQGCLALARRPDPLALDDVPALLADGPRIVVGLERVTNPDNVGTIFRSAHAFGACAVLLSPGCAHPLYRKALRTSMGTALSLAFAHPEPWPAALGRLQDAGYALLALTPAPAAEDLDGALSRLPLSVRTVLLLGSEERGLDAATLELADGHVRIPMAPGSDSLNVAATAAIALHRVHALLARRDP